MTKSTTTHTIITGSGSGTFTLSNTANQHHSIYVGSGGSGGASGTLITTPATGTGSNWWTSNPTVNINDKGIELKANCDLTIGDQSLKEFMKTVSQRLEILQPNKQLESEWAELRALGDQYRKLEQELTAKMKTWDILKDE